LPETNKRRTKIYSTRNERETIICSSTPSNEKRRRKIIDDFALLLRGYQRASEENDFTIYLGTIFRVISAPGLQRVFNESLEEGYELDDSSKKIDARYVLLQYLESLELFTPTLIERILQQLEDGKREDGLFNDADEEVCEVYELFCSSSFFSKNFFAGSSKVSFSIVMCLESTFVTLYSVTKFVLVNTSFIISGFTLLHMSSNSYQFGFGCLLVLGPIFLWDWDLEM
jgi:hypothetical protein